MHEEEDEARERVAEALFSSPFAEAVEVRFRAAYFQSPTATMTTAYEAVSQDMLAVAPELAVGKPAEAARYVVAAVVFKILDDRELDEPIAKILGLSYDDAKWPGPRCVPSFAGPR
jgi:hypothetical protein